METGETPVLRKRPRSGERGRSDLKNFICSLLLRLDDFEREIGGDGVLGAAFAKAVDVEIDAVAVVDDTNSGGRGDQDFPTIGHHHRGMHFEGLAVDDDGGFDGLPADVLLFGSERDFHGVKVVLIAWLHAGRQVGDLRRTASEER